ncbi:conserved hypothetical protein [Ricinus communis]|nr:conserved hypothetical protein [Ricinus communis]|eukprot:XP_002533580.1 NAD(P)H-quinone oxidoreductase subunit T, chloroplastic [Ricinus communis]
MASTTSPQASYSLLFRSRSSIHSSKEHQLIVRGAITRSKKNNGGSSFLVLAAAQGPEKKERAPPGVDTRIHWDNPDEGWIGGSSSSSSSQQQLNEEEEQKNLFGQNFADLLNDASGSHYQ